MVPDLTEPSVSGTISLFMLINFRLKLTKRSRASGTSIYHPACENCRLCIPLRVNVPSFQPSRSQKRTQRKNQDLRIEHVPVVFREDVFELYRRYQEHWHQRGNPTSREEFVEFLIDSPVPSEMILFWLEDKLLGVSWIDRLKDSTSAVYFAFDPNAQHRRLGYLTRKKCNTRQTFAPQRFYYIIFGHP